MNLKFRKKPVVIEAFQMTEARRQDNSEWPSWLNQAWNEENMKGQRVLKIKVMPDNTIRWAQVKSKRLLRKKLLWIRRLIFRCEGKKIFHCWHEVDFPTIQGCCGCPAEKAIATRKG